MSNIILNNKTLFEGWNRVNARLTQFLGKTLSSLKGSQFELRLKPELKKLMLLWGGEFSLIQRFDITHYECECVIVNKCKYNPLNLRHLSSKDLL